MIPQVNNELSRLGRWLDDNVGHAEMPGDPVEVTDSLDRVGRECGYMVEAIAEDMEQKVDILTRLEAAGTRETIFVTTTSGLSITELGRRSATGPRLVGAHFWNPPHLMPLVEVIRGDDTQDGAFELIMDLVASIGRSQSGSTTMCRGSSAIVYCTLCGVRRSIWWAGVSLRRRT